MARKRFTTEQIIGLLREAEVRLSQGQAIGTVCRGIGVSQQSYYRWRREYGGASKTGSNARPRRCHLTWIFRGLTSSAFGRVSVSTPSFISAVILCSSMLLGDRLKLRR